MRRLPLCWRLLRRRNLPIRFRRGCSRLGPFASAPASRLRAFARRGFLDDAQHLANLDVLSVLPRYPAQHAGLRSADLEIDLVGLELHERVTGGDHVSFVSQPFRDPGVDDGFSDLRHDDIRSHVLVCPCLTGRWRPAGAASAVPPVL